MPLIPPPLAPSTPPPPENRTVEILDSHGRLTLRVKGGITLAIMVVYVAITTAILTGERLKLPAIVKELEVLHKLEEQNVKVNALITRAIIAASEAYFIEQGDIRTKQLFMEMAPLESTLASISGHYTPLKEHQAQLTKLTRELAHQPSKTVLESMHNGLQRAILDLNAFSNNLHRDKQILLGSYQQVHDKLTVQTMLFSFMGIMMFGAVMTIFFARLTWDIRRAGMRAMAIVKGYRGAPLAVSRSDEIGGLMGAINQMQSELRERERQLELSRQQQFHHEKMAAVGSLAAAVAHEVNNPIMAITGLAQVMIDQRSDEPPVTLTSDVDIPSMILEQAKRLSTITRHISEFATPQSHEPQLVDLNSIVRTTANFVRFDQRYRRITLLINEDKQLSAVHTVADHVAQILINLMINAADALEEANDHKPTVTVSTKQQSTHVELTIQDNGCGMPQETLAHACDEFFTTKPKGKGSGLGLFLSKKLLEQDNATLSINSTPGTGTIVTIRFPINQTGN